MSIPPVRPGSLQILQTGRPLDGRFAKIMADSPPPAPPPTPPAPPPPPPPPPREEGGD